MARTGSKSPSEPTPFKRELWTNSIPSSGASGVRSVWRMPRRLFQWLNRPHQLPNPNPLVLAKLATGNRFRIWQALQRQKHRRHAGASSLVINALDDLSGLLAEFRPESSSMTFAGTDINTWSSVAGSDPLTLTSYGDGGGNPTLMLNALGAGNTGVYFQGGKMTASVNWSPADLTAIWVGNVDSTNLAAIYFSAARVRRSRRHGAAVVGSLAVNQWGRVSDLLRHQLAGVINRSRLEPGANAARGLAASWPLVLRRDRRGRGRRGIRFQQRGGL